MVTTGARHQALVGVAFARQADLDIRFRHALEGVAEFADHQLRRVGVDVLVDRRHHAHLHQRLDDVGAAFGHARGELLHRDDFGNHDLALDLRGRALVDEHPAAFFFARAAHRRERAGAHRVVAFERGGDVDAAGTLAAAHVAPRPDRRALGRHHHAGAARARVAAVFLLRRHGGELGGGRLARDLGGLAALGLVLGGLLARFLFGLALRLFVGDALGLVLGAAAILFLLAATLLVGLAAGLVLDAARFGILGARGLVADGALERAHAGGAFFLGQRAQDLRALRCAAAGAAFRPARARAPPGAARRVGRLAAGVGAGAGAPPGPTTRFLRTST